MTAEEDARQRENREHFRRVLAKRLERDGATPDEIRRRLGPPQVDLPPSR